jgi:riboflavin kinase / FMN adenylyltransferase
LSGTVVQGRQLGRQLGFPTANIALMQAKLPLLGIYVVEVVHQQQRYAGVASLGYNPTVSNDLQPKLEVYIFDFANDLYGQQLQLHFLHKLRDEVKYESLPLLQQQIARDVAQAKLLLPALLAATNPTQA